MGAFSRQETMVIVPVKHLLDQEIYSRTLDSRCAHAEDRISLGTYLLVLEAHEISKVGGG